MPACSFPASSPFRPALTPAPICQPKGTGAASGSSPQLPDDVGRAAIANLASAPALTKSKAPLPPGPPGPRPVVGSYQMNAIVAVALSHPHTNTHPSCQFCLWKAVSGKKVSAKEAEELARYDWAIGCFYKPKQISNLSHPLPPYSAGSGYVKISIGQAHRNPYVANVTREVRV